MTSSGGFGTDDEAPKRRGRPRSKDCHEATLASAVELLESRGYDGVTMEGIAAHARVAKQTLYKWWPSKAKLVMEAYADRIGRRMPIPDTGTVEGDLKVFMAGVCRVLRRGNARSSFAGLIAEAQTDPDLHREFRETFIAARRAAATVILSRGVSRGELRGDIDVAMVIDLLHGPVWYRLLVRHAPLDASFSEALVDLVLPALRPPPAR